MRRQPAGTPRRIAVMPACDGEATAISVLERLEPLADEIIIVGDGSSDRTRDAILAWAESRPNVRLLFFNRNRGVSAAYCAASQDLARRVARGDLSPDDIVLTVDADGQHEPSDIEAVVAPILDDRFDAVIARRDLSGHSAYRRSGNWLISVWASLWAARRLHDIESGFRAFRLGAWLAALQYCQGSRHSESVQVAVVLPHLGYRVSNDLVVPAPTPGSRTRLKDGVVDFAAVVAAWWRILAGRTRPPGMPSWSVYVLPALGILGLLFMTVDLLINPIFLGNDSMQPYAHIWYISQQLFDHGRVPLHMSLLDGGRAVTFPYGFPPFLAGAVLFRALGDWAVALMMAVAVVGTVWAAGLVRPVMRDPWFVLLFVMNPFFIDAVYSFQFASLWSILFFFLFVWAFERRRYPLAAALLWLTVSTHPVEGGAAAGVYGLCLLVFDRGKVRPLVFLSIPVGVALIPIFWMTLLTPTVHENSLRTVVGSVGDTLPRRAIMIAAPFAVTPLVPYIRRFYRPTLATLAVLMGIGVMWATTPVSGVYGSYYGAIHRSTNIYAAFFQSPQFQPGATYRVLEPNEREDGMYRFMQHGAILSNEFFTESMFYLNWTEPQYSCYVAFKGIQYVVVEKAFLHQFGVNEEEVLQSLVAAERASVSYVDPGGKFTVYDVRRFAAERAKPESLSECGVYQ